MSDRKVYFVHYTVENPPGTKKHMVAGPYREDEVLAQRLDIAGYMGVIDSYVNDSNQRAPE